MSYSANVNQNTFQFTEEDLQQADFTTQDGRHFHVLLNNEAYRAELLETDWQEKAFVFKINGNRYAVKLADDLDRMVERLGLGKVSKKHSLDINAPMPGMVLKILVNEGDEVEEGQSLLILEAMKMENVLKAPAAAQVNALTVQQGDKVDKGQLLIKLR